MSLSIFLLIVVSSFLHASWNFLAKTISGGVPFVWLIAVVMSTMRQHHWKIILISVMSPVAFILVLYAMLSTPVHVVAPAREMSIVFGVVFGARLLTEENFLPRLGGSLLILSGIVLLAS